MKITTNELTLLITALDGTLQSDFDNLETEKLLKKLSKELKKRGFETIISKEWLGEEKEE